MGYGGKWLRRVSDTIHQTFLRALPDAVRQSYLLKLLTVVAIVFLLGTVISTVFFFTLSDTLNEQVEQQIETTTEYRAAVYANWFEDKQEAVSSLAVKPAFAREYPQEYVFTDLFISRVNNPVVSNYYLMNASSGRVLASTDAASIGDGLYAGQFNRTVVERSSQFLTVTGSPAFGNRTRLVFWAHTPYANRVLVAEVTSNRTGLDLPETTAESQSYIVNSSGRVVFGPRNLSVTPEGMPENAVVRRENGTVASYQRIPGTELLVVTTTPVDQAFRLKQEVLVSFVVTLLLLLGTLAGATLIGGRAAVADLNTLVRKSESMSDGNFDVDLSTDRRDEFGTLYESLAEMRDAIREQFNEVQNARAAAQEAKSELQRHNDEIEEQRAIISVLNRVLRHNLRNGTNVMIGHLEFLEMDVPPEKREYHRRELRGKIHDLLDKAEKARYIEELVHSESTRLEEIDITETLADEVERFRASYPQADIEADIQTDTGESVRVYAHETVEFVFENLVENAIEHNTSASPEVEITVSRTVDDEWVRVQIADNGPGIPDGEVEVLEEGYETAIHHASGIGLWITNWLVSEMDGDLRFTERDPTGTVVTVSLRATPQEDTAQSDSQLPSGSHR